MYKAGPHVCNNSEAVNEIRSIGFNVAALSNNHIMDYGASALRRTIYCFHKNNIKTVGAGFDFDEVYTPFVLENENERVAVFNLCQAEFGVFKTENCIAGYAWINHPSVIDRIKKAKESFSKVIIFAHAGLEESPYPLPEWQQTYHSFIDAGADIVVGNHPHTIQGKEIYKDCAIFYSLGNFFFSIDMGSMENDFDWNLGYMVSLNTENMSTEIIPVENKNGKLEIAEQERFWTTFHDRCSGLSCQKDLESLADNLAERLWGKYYKSYYLSCFQCFSTRRMIKYILFSLLHKDKKCFQNIDETMLLHNIQNETHRMIVERFLFIQNSKKNNLLL